VALAASERKQREREGDEALTGGAWVSAGGSRAWGWAAWAEERGGEAWARGAGWAGIRPNRGRGDVLLFFLFLILIPFFSFFYFCFFFFGDQKYFLSDLE
jgi:hypothetical protein